MTTGFNRRAALFCSSSYSLWLWMLVLLSCSSSISRTAQANVIGIDFASDSFKVAVVQPGTPLEIVTNLQSKRKTPMCLSFYRGERLFGADAMALMGRKPDITYSKLYRLLGRGPEHPIVKELTEEQFFPYQIYANESTGATCVKFEESQYAPEELVAMMLEHVKELTVNFGGKAIKDCVITVPASFTQHEKQALYTAADIADMKVLSLMEENTAAALHYAIDRTFSPEDPPTVVLYFNMGAGSVQVSVVSYSAYPSKEQGKNKSVNSFEVIGKAWDQSLGGFNFDVRLADLLAQRFNEVWNKKKSGKGKDLRDFTMPMTKLRLQASKVKEVLSANPDFPVRAEQLHDDTDLNTKVSRQELEDACADLYERLTAPIDKALLMANVSIKDVHAVELLGGGVRMPKVKTVLQDYLTAREVDSSIIGQHLNGDEAMALGAAFRAANLSTAFRVRKIGAADVLPFGIAVRLTALEDEVATTATGGGVFGGMFGGSSSSKDKKKTAVAEEGTEQWSKFTPLYPLKSMLPGKTKTVAFQFDRDIVCRLEYDNTSTLLPPGTGRLIAEYNISGIAAFAAEHAEKQLGAPKVHLSFALNDAGMVSLSKAEVTYELPAATAEPEEAEINAVNATAPADTDAAAAEGNSEESDATAAETEAPSSAEVNGTDASNTNSTTASDSSSSQSSKAKKPSSSSSKKDKKKDNVIRKPLVVAKALVSSVTAAGAAALGASAAQWTEAQIAESRERLAELRAVDDLRRAKEAALNDLEGFIYKVKNTIMDQEKEMKAVSTEEQRQEVVDMANEAEEWLYDEGRDQPVSVYKSKQQEIGGKFRAITLRLQELTARPAAVEKALGQLKNVTQLVGTWETKLPHITDEEKDKLHQAIADAETWINEKVKEQEAADSTATPVFLSTEIPSQLKSVKLMLEKLTKKPKPVPPKPEKNATAEANGTAEANSEGSVKVELEEDATAAVEEENDDSPFAEDTAATDDTADEAAPKKEEL